MWLIDFDEPTNNDWLAVNQFTIIEGGKNRRPDVLVFVNGLPLGLLELKNPANEDATLKNAWNQDPELPLGHPVSLHSQRGDRHLGRHQRRHEFVHGRFRALRAVEDDRGARGCHQPACA